MLLRGPRGVSSPCGQSKKQGVAMPAVPARLASCTQFSVQQPVITTPAVHQCSRKQSRRSAAVVKAVAVQAAQPAAGSFQRGGHWEVHKFGGTCMSAAERIKAVSDLLIKEPGDNKVVVVSAMGSHPSSPIKVTDLILNMISRAAKQDAAFLLDLAALQDKHVETAKLLLGQSPELNSFVARLLDDIANLKAMLQAMSIGEPSSMQADHWCKHRTWTPCKQAGRGAFRGCALHLGAHG